MTPKLIVWPESFHGGVGTLCLKGEKLWNDAHGTEELVDGSTDVSGKGILGFTQPVSSLRYMAVIGPLNYQANRI